MISQTLERRQVIDYTTFTFIDEMTLLSNSPRPKTKDWFLVLAPFDRFVWGCVLLTVLSLMALFKVLMIFSKKHNTKAPFCNSSIENISKASDYLLENCNNDKAGSSVVKLFYGTTLLSALVLSTAYGANFYALLTLPQYEQPVDSLEDLFAFLKTGQKTVMVYSKMPGIERYFNTSDLSDESNYFAPLAQHLNLRKLFYRLDQLVEKVEENSGNVAIWSRFSLATERYLKAHLPLHIASVSFEPDRLSWIAQKNSPLIKPFNGV